MQNLRQDLHEFIATSPLMEFDDSRFNRLALRLYGWQFHHNLVYQRFCLQNGDASQHPQHWSEIPAVTTSAFKSVTLTCFPPSDAIAEFHTSGTTQQRAGKHYFKTLDYYRQAMLRSFKAYCLPDCDNILMMFLGPTREYYRHSSLGYMFSMLRDEWGGAGSDSFVTSKGLNTIRFVQYLQHTLTKGEPIFVLGTAFALLQCLDEMRQHHLTLALPAGSRILDTGGYKGRTREVPRSELHAMLSERFGVPATHLLNEYGMTELSSQCYESRLAGAPLCDENAAMKFLPPWMRAVAVDPNTLRLLPSGELGMLRFYDLANVDSVLAIQTEDLGRAWLDRLLLHGRATGAELRGCSLLTEEIVAGGGT